MLFPGNITYRKFNFSIFSFYQVQTFIWTDAVNKSEISFLNSTCAFSPFHVATNAVISSETLLSPDFIPSLVNSCSISQLVSGAHFRTKQLWIVVVFISPFIFFVAKTSGHSRRDSDYGWGVRLNSQDCGKRHQPQEHFLFGSDAELVTTALNSCR